MLANLNSKGSADSKNFYDVTILKRKSSTSLSNKKKFVFGSQRTASLNSIHSLAESKRPSDYYIQKSSNSSVNLLSQPTPVARGTTTRRPTSSTSVLSSYSTLSDDYSLINSSQFETHDSRLSSMTSHSNSSPTCSPSENGFSFLGASIDSKIEEEKETDNSLPNTSLDQVNSSVSTITLKEVGMKDVSNEFNIELSFGNSSNSFTHRPVFKSASTASVVPQRKNFGMHSSGSVQALTRTKSRYINSEEKKERRLQRKKAFEENDDDEILEGDFDLVYNVPVMKEQRKVLSRRRSTPALKRSDLIGSGMDSKYNFDLSRIEPTPLLGKLKSNSVCDSIDEIKNEETSSNDYSPSRDSTITSHDDSEIVNMISNMYREEPENLENESLNEDKEIKSGFIYSLPKFVTSQSKIDDLSLMSPTKLGFVDQTRPINLPPKPEVDKSKHKKEFRRVLSEYENTNKLKNETRQRSIRSLLAGEQQWLKYTILDEKELTKKLAQEKLPLRKMAWCSVCPKKLRFDFFMKTLRCSVEPGIFEKISKSYDASALKYENLSESIRNNRGLEFDGTVNFVLSRPLFESLIKSLTEAEASNFDLNDFKKNFKTLLFIKLFSDSNLKKHEEVFLIPICLTVFDCNYSIKDIYTLVELFNYVVFSDMFLTELRKSLKSWESKSARSKAVAKQLKGFDSFKEFEDLSTYRFIEILLQMNDRLPLSLSAPSTPLLTTSPYFPSMSSGTCDAGQRTKAGEEKVSIISSSLSLMAVLLQILVVYGSSPRTRVKNNLRVVESFLVVIFKDYHINWNLIGELVKSNKSIKLNYSTDQALNLNSYLEKWRKVFENFQLSGHFHT